MSMGDAICQPFRYMVRSQYVPSQLLLVVGTAHAFPAGQIFSFLSMVHDNDE